MDSGASNASTVWRQVATSQEPRTWCLAPIWRPLLASDPAPDLVPGTELGGLFASIDGLGSETQATVDLLYRVTGVAGD